MPTKTTKKLNKRAKHLKKGKKLEATRPLTDVATPSLFSKTANGTHYKQATLTY
jgi:type VI protein secretion system component Hcp